VRSSQPRSLALGDVVLVVTPQTPDIGLARGLFELALNLGRPPGPSRMVWTLVAVKEGVAVAQREYRTRRKAEAAQTRAADAAQAAMSGGRFIDWEFLLAQV